MKRIILLLLIPCFILACQSEETSDSKEKEEEKADPKEEENKKAAVEVQKTWDKIVQVIKDRKGDEAADLINQNTLDFYKEQLDNIKYATREELNEMNAIDVAGIVSARHVIEKEKLATGDARSLMVHSVNSGLLEQTMSKVGIGEIEVYGDKAQAGVIYEGTAIPMLNMAFVKENNRWKVDIPSMLENAKDLLATFGSRQMSQDIINQSLEEASKVKGAEPDESIWEPPFERE